MTMNDTVELKEQSQWMQAHIKWLKRQVREAKERRYPSSSWFYNSERQTNIDREILAADRDLQDYIKMLKEHGYKT